MLKYFLKQDKDNKPILDNNIFVACIVTALWLLVVAVITFVVHFDTITGAEADNDASLWYVLVLFTVVLCMIVALGLILPRLLKLDRYKVIAVVNIIFALVMVVYIAVFVISDIRDNNLYYFLFVGVSPLVVIATSTIIGVVRINNKLANKAVV